MPEFMIFYGKGWLQCAIPTSAPYNNLYAIWQMRQYSKLRPSPANACLKSMATHPWYLCENLVVLSLAHENLVDGKRKTVATAFLNTPRPDIFPLGKPKFPDVTQDTFWPEEGVMARLSTLVGPGLWLLFERLKMKELEIEWLMFKPTQWPMMSGYTRYSKFVKNSWL